MVVIVVIGIAIFIMITIIIIVIIFIQRRNQIPANRSGESDLTYCVRLAINQVGSYKTVQV